MSQMSEAMACLSRKLEESAGYDIIYSRGDTQWSFKAWTGSQIFAVSTPDATARVVRSDHDWTFDRENAEAAGWAMPPLKGDRITVTDGATTCVFELSTPTNEAVWRRGDNEPVPKKIRVHTRRIA